MKHLRSFNENLKSEDEFTEYMDRVYPVGIKDSERKGMLKGYDFLIKWLKHSKLNKIGSLFHEKLVDYMHEIYPNDSQLPEREGMNKVYYFFSGEYDRDEVERKKISKLIQAKMKKNFGN